MKMIIPITPKQIRHGQNLSTLVNTFPLDARVGNIIFEGGQAGMSMGNSGNITPKLVFTLIIPTGKRGTTIYVPPKYSQSELESVIIKKRQQFGEIS